MARLGKNVGGYLGERIHIDAVIERILHSARAKSWEIETETTTNGVSLQFLIRRGLPDARRIYISSGIHGDEPAGPMAMLQLFEEDRWPRELSLWIAPCLNPTGFPLNRRENHDGIDLNRDYLHLRTPEVQTHTKWLLRQPAFDLAICLHEDWESNGFYLYELNPDNLPSLADSIVNVVSRICPIESSDLIDGRHATRPGIIRPNLDPASRPEWPEAFLLVKHKTRLNYTFETPSDFHLQMRVDALVTAVSRSLI